MKSNDSMMNAKFSLKALMVCVASFALLAMLLKSAMYNRQLEEAISRLKSSKVLDAVQEREVFRQLATQSTGLEISFEHLDNYQPRSTFPKAGDTIEIRVNRRSIMHKLIDPRNLKELMLE